MISHVKLRSTTVSNQDLAELPIAEKLRMMESLWDSLLHEAQGNQAVPEWHKDVLSERASRLDSGVEVSSPWEEAKRRIRQQTEVG